MGTPTPLTISATTAFGVKGAGACRSKRVGICCSGDGAVVPRGSSSSIVQAYTQHLVHGRGVSVSLETSEVNASDLTPTPNPNLFARHHLHPTRHNHAFQAQTVAPGAVRARKPTQPQHQLHLTRHNHTFQGKSVASGAAGNRKLALPQHHLHLTRQNHAFRAQTVAPGAVRARELAPI